MPRIIYISTKTLTPAGGVKVIFQHVQGLRELGFDAYVGHPIDNYRPDWFDADIPILYYLKGMKAYPDDVFVIPETGFKTLRLLKKIKSRKVMFCQNWFGVQQGLGSARHWNDFDISAVLACSNVVEDCARETFGYKNTSVITCPIDQQIFSPQAKKKQIAYMPRKRKQDIGQIKTFFHLLAPEIDFPWIAIDGMAQKKVANVLAESAIFLSLSKREGLGLPPLEAMASGSLVAGFHGVGGLEYANESNGLWCQEEDLFDCARQLARACQLVADNEPGLRQMVEGGLVTAQHYCYDQMKADLKQFWQPFLAQSAVF